MLVIFKFLVRLDDRKGYEYDSSDRQNQTRKSSRSLVYFPACQSTKISGLFWIATMKHIQLTQGKHALVDNEDYPIVSQNKWHISKGYAVRDIILRDLNGKREQIHISMHQQIMNTPLGWDTHHKNNNRLDNRRKNLLVCKRKEHFANHNLKKN